MEGRGVDSMETRERLIQEIEETRMAFYSLLNSVPEEAFSLPSDNPAWDIQQVFYHIAIVPRYIDFEVQMIRRQVRAYQLVPRLVPKRLFDWLNARLTRIGARGMTRQRLGKVYEQSYRAALHSLDKVADEDFEKSLVYPLWDPLLAGEVTVAYLFGYIKRHFDSHAAQIEKALPKH
jgi:hypothetical protein